MNRFSRTFAMSAVLLLAVGLVMAAETPAEKTPAIGGYCPVGYVKAKMAIKGDARYASEQDGLLFYLSSPEAMKMFEAEPAKYRVGYHGWCATGIAMGKKLASDPRLFTVHKGVTYLFSSAEAKTAFDKDPDMLIAKADGNWPNLK
jgi:YHS domain-containing protein